MSFTAVLICNLLHKMLWTALSISYFITFWPPVAPPSTPLLKAQTCYFLTALTADLSTSLFGFTSKIYSASPRAHHLILAQVIRISEVNQHTQQISHPFCLTTICSLLSLNTLDPVNPCLKLWLPITLGINSKFFIKAFVLSSVGRFSYLFILIFIFFIF